MTGFASDLRVSGAGSPGPSDSLLLSRARLGVPLVTAIAALILIGGNAAGRPGLAAAVIVVQIVLGAAWLLEFSMGIDAAVLVTAAFVASDIVLLRTRTPTGGSIAGVLGLSVIAVLFHQIARRGANNRGVTETVAITLSVITLGSALTLLFPLRVLADGRWTVLVGVVTAAAAQVVVRLVPGPDALRRVAGLVAAGLVGLAFGSQNHGLLTSAKGLYLGLATGVTVLLVDRLLERTKLPEHPGTVYVSVITGLVPLMLSAPIAYLVGRIVYSGSFAYVAGQLITTGGR